MPATSRPTPFCEEQAPSPLLNSVRRALLRANERLSPGDIEATSSLVDDLGFDSLKFVDLALALEDELCIVEFPVQAWYDAEYALSDRRFTVASLVAACEQCLAESR